MNLNKSPNIDMIKLPEGSMYKIENPTKEIGYIQKTDRDGKTVINETMANRWCLFGTWYETKEGKVWMEIHIQMPNTGEIRIPILPGEIMYFNSNTFLVLDDHRVFGDCFCAVCKQLYGLKSFNQVRYIADKPRPCAISNISMREIIHRDDFGRPIYGPDVLEDHKLMENEDFEDSSEVPDSWCKTSTLPLFFNIK